VGHRVGFDANEAKKIAMPRFEPRRPTCSRPYIMWSRDSWVDVATDYRLDGPGSIPESVRRLFSSL
jgi:hypothetical protein